MKCQSYALLFRVFSGEQSASQNRYISLVLGTMRILSITGLVIDIIKILILLDNVTCIGSNIYGLILSINMWSCCTE